MDLFVSVPGLTDIESLERLHTAVSCLAVPGTLSIVRGARVPIVKYVDARGSGIFS